MWRRLQGPQGLTLRLLVLCNHWASGNFEECREVLAAFSFILVKGQSDQLWGSWFSRLPPQGSLENGGKCLLGSFPGGIPGWLPYRTCGGRGNLSSHLYLLIDCLPFQSIRIYTPPKIAAASKWWAQSLWARCSSRCILCVNSFHSHNHPMGKTWLLAQFDEWDNQGTKGKGELRLNEVVLASESTP